MKQSWLRIIPSLVSHSIHSSTQFSITSDPLVNTICDSLRKSLNWDALTRKFNRVQLSNSIIEKVLLQLKDPIDAKRALGFFHWSAQNLNFKHGTSNYCIAIHILARAKLIKDARALLESILTKPISGNSSQFLIVDELISSYKPTNSTPFVFDLLIQTYAKLRMIDIAFSVCKYLDEHGFTLSVISYNTLIHVVEKSDDQTSLIWEVYEHMIEKRTYPNEITVRIMIFALCKEGELQKFVDMLDRIHGKRCSPAVIVNSCLIFRVLEDGRIEEGMMLLKRLLLKNMILDTISYSLIVYSRVKLGSLDSAWEVYEEMLKKGFSANSFIYTVFIEVNCKEEKIEAANHLVQEMKNMGLKPYAETFNHLIMGCSKVGRLEESLKFCEEMVEMGLVPSCLAFNEMVGKLCETGCMKHADEMLTIVLDRGFVPNEFTFSHLIAGHARDGNVHEVLKLYYEMEYKLISPGLSVFESVITSLCRCGRLEDAEKYLKIMKDRCLAPSTHLNNILIAINSKKGAKTRAPYVNGEMVKKGSELGGAKNSQANFS